MHVDRKLRSLEDEREASYLRQCLGKIGYLGQTNAEDYRKTLGNKYYKLHSYQCNVCSMWHLGHKTRGK